MSEKKNTAPKNETKQQKFVRIAAPRVTKVLTALRLLSNCAGSGYEYSPDQMNRVASTISKAVEDMKSCFAKRQATKGEGFKF